MVFSYSIVSKSPYIVGLIYCMHSEMTISKKAAPFLRWTGSKKWLVKNGIHQYIPDRFNNYHEPFVGAGAVFFYLKPRGKSYLNDINEDLINAYQQIRDNPDLVIKYLQGKKSNESTFYRVRSSNCRTKHTKAGRLVYLNRTCFNGIYRVNPQGVFNVPFGKRENVDIVTESNLRLVSDALKGCTLTSYDFYDCLQNVEKGDLVYLDPPYTVAHENNGFIEYNSKIFSWEDQERLREMILRIEEKKAYFILSNACHYSILNLYESFGHIRKHSRHSIVGGRAKTRGTYNELVICNTLDV